jgi:hypothetical protein
MKSKLLLLMTALLCVGVFAASAAHSASESFSFSVDTTQGIFGDPGSTTVLATHAVDEALVGRACQLTFDVHNNDSVRGGTDFLVTSNGLTLTVPDVERNAGDAAPAVVGDLALGATVTISLRFGPEGAASVSATAIVDCPDTPTTTPPPPTTVVPSVVVSPAASARPAATPQPSAAVVVAQPRFTG